MAKFKRAITLLAGIGVAIALADGATAAAKTTVHVHNTLIGAQVGAGETVYEIRGSRRGAAVQFIKPNAAGTGGTYTNTSYFGVGTIVAVGQYTVGPGTNGLISIHSHGRFVRGTGLFKHISGKFTASGTLDPKTGHLKVVIAGTQTY